MTTDPLEVAQPRREMSPAQQLGYVCGTLQIADRDLAQLISEAENVKAMGRRPVQVIQRVGYLLRSALDAVDGHGDTVTPCWCSRHWPAHVPLR